MKRKFMASVAVITLALSVSVIAYTAQLPINNGTYRELAAASAGQTAPVGLSVTEALDIAFEISGGTIITELELLVEEGFLVYHIVVDNGLRFEIFIDAHNGNVFRVITGQIPMVGQTIQPPAPDYSPHPPAAQQPDTNLGVTPVQQPLQLPVQQWSNPYSPRYWYSSPRYWYSSPGYWYSSPRYRYSSPGYWRHSPHSPHHRRGAGWRGGW